MISKLQWKGSEKWCMVRVQRVTVWRTRDNRRWIFWGGCWYKRRRRVDDDGCAAEPITHEASVGIWAVGMFQIGYIKPLSRIRWLTACRHYPCSNTLTCMYSQPIFAIWWCLSIFSVSSNWSTCSRRSMASSKSEEAPLISVRNQREARFSNGICIVKSDPSESKTNWHLSSVTNLTRCLSFPALLNGISKPPQKLYRWRWYHVQWISNCNYLLHQRCIFFVIHVVLSTSGMVPEHCRKKRIAIESVEIYAV